MVTVPRLAPKVVLCVLIVLLLLVFADVAPMAKNSQQDQPGGRLKLKNNVPRFKVVDWRRPLPSSDLFELTFRNDYDKPIAVYELKLGDGLNMLQDFVGTGEYIQPGHDYVVRNSLPAGQKLRVLGVIFEDGTFDGVDPSFVHYIKNWRLGFRIRLQQINKILQEGSSHPNDSQTVEDLMKRISTLPTELPGVPDAHFGFHFANERAIHHLQELQQSGAGLARLALDANFVTLTDRYQAELHRLLEAEARQ